MLEEAALDEGTLADALTAGWGVTATSVEFLPLGYDNRSWAYAVRDEDGTRLFLKLRSGRVAPASLEVPRLLHERGVTGVVPPAPTRDGALSRRVDGHELVLYPFVPGTSAARAGMTDRQWLAYGAFVGALHGTDLPEAVTAAMPRETFRTGWLPVVRRLSARIARERFDDPWRRDLAAFWRGRQDEITALADRTAALGRLAADRELPLVPCHADIHSANLLVDGPDRIVVVDWDEVMLAPRERDLMFLLGAGIGIHPVDARREALVMRGYGDHPVDAVALTYYRYRWAVADIGAYGEAMFEFDEFGAANREQSVDGLRRLWDAGAIVDIARESDGRLPATT